MTHELENALLDVMEIYRYKGCYVMKIKDGWEVFGQKVKTPQEVDQVLDQAAQHLKNSITVVNNGSMESQNN